MNLYDLMTGAQGGQGVNTLASQFGLSAQQTQAALQALAPAFSLALQNATQDPTGFGALLNQMTNGAHAAAYANPGAAAPAGLERQRCSARSSARSRSPSRSASRRRRPQG